MIAIVNKNKLNNKFLPMISLVNDTKTLKKQCKVQLMKEIIENPTSLKAYKEIEVYKIAEVNEEMELKECNKKLLFTYEELLKQIVEQMTEYQTKNNIKGKDELEK